MRTSALPVALLVVASLASATAPADASRGQRATPVRRVRPARQRVVPLAIRKQQNKALLEKLGAKEKAADQQARREVDAMSDLELAAFGFKPHQRELAFKARRGMIYTRNQRRMEEAGKTVDKLLALEEAAGNDGERAALRRTQAEVMRSGRLNRALGTEKNGPRLLKRALHMRAPWLSRFVPWLRRDTQWSPGSVAANIQAPAGAQATDTLDPVDSTMWTRRKAERVTPESIAAGPWMKADKRPTLPAEGTVLELESFRSLDADGVHPSVFVTDPVTGTEWKVKFQGADAGAISSEPVVSRLLYAMGYHSSPVYTAPSLRLSPHAVLAAYTHKQRVGIRIKENSFLSRWLRVKPGKYGRSPYKMRDQIVDLSYAGEVVSGPAAHELLVQARKNPAILEDIDYVTVRGVDLALKGEGGGESMGPFRPDDPQHVDRREMRALSIISASWLKGNDTRFNNLRLDVEDDDGQIELKHVFADAGAHLEGTRPESFGPEVDLDLTAPRLHDDTNRMTLHAYDRTTLDDARWAVRQIAALSPAQIRAAVKAGATDASAESYYTTRLIQRRNDLVKKVGLDKEIPALGTEP